MNILGIETSCDETGAAIVKNGRHILSNITATSADIHSKTGGVIPEDAARKQVESIIPVVGLCLKESKLRIGEIDAFAVTVGPGLIGSLLVGSETAKTIAHALNKPLIPVNHLIAHIYANWISKEIPHRVRSSQVANSERDDKASLKSLPALSNIKAHGTPRFPALALVVSGGHTDLVLMTGHGKLKWIGGTRDDAAGEAFDKIARLLGIKYPGGPNLAKIADDYIMNNPSEQLDRYPRPMINNSGFDWSFSGLKTAVLNDIKNNYLKNNRNLRLSDYKKTSSNLVIKKHMPLISANVQEAVVNVLVKKTLRAVKKYEPVSLLISGGVAANKRLSDVFMSEIRSGKLKIKFHVPPSSICTDNAASIASCAFFNNNPVVVNEINIDPQLTIAGEK